MSVKIDITTPAILFPALSLLTLAYTNKFLALASIIRQLSLKIMDVPDENLLKQITNLRTRIYLLRYIQAQGLMSIFCCLISIVLLYFDLLGWGNAMFIFSVVLMMGSILMAIWETLMSGKALDLQLQKIFLLHNENKKNRETHD